MRSRTLIIGGVIGSVGGVLIASAHTNWIGYTALGAATSCVLIINVLLAEQRGHRAHISRLYVDNAILASENSFLKTSIDKVVPGFSKRPRRDGGMKIYY